MAPLPRDITTIKPNQDEYERLKNELIMEFQNKHFNDIVYGDKYNRSYRRQLKKWENPNQADSQNDFVQFKIPKPTWARRRNKDYTAESKKTLVAMMKKVIYATRYKIMLVQEERKLARNSSEYYIAYHYLKIKEYDKMLKSIQSSMFWHNTWWLLYHLRAQERCLQLSVDVASHLNAIIKLSDKAIKEKFAKLGKKGLNIPMLYQPEGDGKRPGMKAPKSYGPPTPHDKPSNWKPVKGRTTPKLAG